jgi:hypothetical protein
VSKSFVHKPARIEAFKHAIFQPVKTNRPLSSKQIIKNHPVINVLLVNTSAEHAGCALDNASKI